MWFKYIRNGSVLPPSLSYYIKCVIANSFWITSNSLTTRVLHGTVSPREPLPPLPLSSSSIYHFIKRLHAHSICTAVSLKRRMPSGHVGVHSLGHTPPYAATPTLHDNKHLDIHGHNVPLEDNGFRWRFYKDAVSWEHEGHHVMIQRSGGSTSSGFSGSRMAVVVGVRRDAFWIGKFVITGRDLYWTSIPCIKERVGET